MCDKSRGENTSGFTLDLNPSPLYLQLIGVGQLGLEFSVGQFGGPQLTLEMLKFFLQLSHFLVCIIVLRRAALLLLLQL